MYGILLEYFSIESRDEEEPTISASEVTSLTSQSELSPLFERATLQELSRAFTSMNSSATSLDNSSDEVELLRQFRSEHLDPLMLKVLKETSQRCVSQKSTRRGLKRKRTPSRSPRGSQSPHGSRLSDSSR